MLLPIQNLTLSLIAYTDFEKHVVKNRKQNQHFSYYGIFSVWSLSKNVKFCFSQGRKNRGFLPWLPHIQEPETLFLNIKRPKEDSLKE